MVGPQVAVLDYGSGNLRSVVRAVERAGADVKVDQRVPRERRQHVVIKADTGRDVVLAGAVEVKLDDDVRLGRLPFDLPNT